MGKTVLGILEIAAAVVVQAIPGVGQVVGAVLATSGLSNIVSGLIGGPSIPKPDTTEVAIKNPIPPRLAGYGRVGSYGAYMLFETSSTGVAVDVFAFFDTMGIPYDGVERVYLGDKQVGTGAGVVSGLADGSFGNSAVEIDLRLGAQTETAYSQVTTLLGSTIWDSSHRGDGIVSGMVTWQPVSSKDYLKVYPNSQPALRIVARTQKCFDWRAGGQAIDDPTTWTFTENPWLHYAHYVVTREKTLPPQITPTMTGPEIAAEYAAWHARLSDTWARLFAPTLASWTAAANDADSAVPLKGGGTEPRYRCCLTHKLTDPHKDTKARILATCDGWVAPREDGALVAYAGKYYTPTVAIGPDEILSYSLQEGVEDEQAVNTIAVSYVSSAHDYNTVDATPWVDTADLAFRGREASTAMNPDVPSNGQARRLAKRAMSKTMAPKRGTVTTNSAGRIARGQRFVSLNLTEAGSTFYSGPVEITALTVNIATGGVTFTWVQADLNIDAWDPATEEGDPAPVGSSVTPTALDAPVITSATAQDADVGSDGVTGSTGKRIVITGTGPDRADLAWYVRWRVGTTGSWTESASSDSDGSSGVSLITGFVTLASNVNVEIQYQVGDGRYSPWSSAYVVDAS